MARKPHRRSRLRGQVRSGELVKPSMGRSRHIPAARDAGVKLSPVAEDRGEIASPHGGRTRRRDFTMVLPFAAATQSVQARERATGPVADLRDTGPRAWPAFFGELRRLGDVEATTSPSSAIPARDGPTAMAMSLARSLAAIRT